MRRLALAVGLAACGGDAARVERVRTDRLYAEAERAFSRRDPETIARFEAFVAATDVPEDRALALFRIAEVHERDGDLDAAVATYERVVATGVYERAALAEYRLGVLQREKRGDVVGGEGRLRALVERYPDSAAADKALRYLAVTFDRHRPDPSVDRALVTWMQDVVARMPDRGVADNAVWWTGWVQVFRVGDLGGARRSLRELSTRWPLSPLLDPGTALLGQLYERMGEWRLAIDAWSVLLRVHDSDPLLVGEFRTPALDDAAQRVGALWYHGLRDLEAAEAAWRRLLALFPTARTRDDAWWGIANVRLERGDRPGTEQALRALLEETPTSRWAKRARALLDGDASPDLRDPPDPARVRSPLLRPTADGNL